MLSHFIVSDTAGAFLTHYIRTIVHSLDNSKNQLIEGHNILFTVDEIEIANSS